MCPRRTILAYILSALLLSAHVPAQGLPSDSKSAAKICVAMVANASTTSAFVERLTDRLTKSLKDNKVQAISMDSQTSSRYPLQVSTKNGEEIKEKKCDYVLLSQIRDPRQHPLEPRVPEISIGGRVPSIDAADPLGGDSGPVYRANLQVAFALFKMGRLKPVLDTYVLERPAKFVMDTLLPAMDHEANRIASELKKDSHRLPE